MVGVDDAFSFLSKLTLKKKLRIELTVNSSPHRKRVELVIDAHRDQPKSESSHSVKFCTKTVMK
jgi:hypothetical protein